MLAVCTAVRRARSTRNMAKSSEAADRKKWGDASSSESKKLVRPAAPPHLSLLDC